MIVVRVVVGVADVVGAQLPSPGWQSVGPIQALPCSTCAWVTTYCRLPFSSQASVHASCRSVQSTLPELYTVVDVLVVVVRMVVVVSEVNVVVVLVFLVVVVLVLVVIVAGVGLVVTQFLSPSVQITVPAPILFPPS